MQNKDNGFPISFMSSPYICISSSTYFCYYFTNLFYFVRNLCTYNRYIYLFNGPWSHLYDIKGKRRKLDICFVKLSKYVKAKGRHCRAML